MEALSLPLSGDTRRNSSFCGLPGVQSTDEREFTLRFFYEHPTQNILRQEKHAVSDESIGQDWMMIWRFENASEALMTEVLFWLRELSWMVKGQPLLLPSVAPILRVVSCRGACSPLLTPPCLSPSSNSRHRSLVDVRSSTCGVPCRRLSGDLVPVPLVTKCEKINMG